MIPEFNENGLLPSGIYNVSIEEFKTRFVINKRREEIFDGILKLMADLKTIGCNAFYIDGSFVTSKRRPGDADICWELTSGEDFLNFAKRNAPLLFDTKYPRARQQAIYKADVLPASVPADKDGMLYLDFFQQDKQTGEKKGIIKIELI